MDMGTRMYALIRSNEDGEPIRLLNSDQLKELLTNPIEYANIREFKDGAWYGRNPDTQYWLDGVGVLVKIEVIVPTPVTTAYVID